MGISAPALSSEESSLDEVDATFLDLLATDFFFEARGETDFLLFFYFRGDALSFFSYTSC